MLSRLIALSKRLPESTRERLRRTGIPYCASYLAKYREVHDVRTFCGDLPSVKDAYTKSTGQEKTQLAGRFDKIIDSLVMRNGVKKTTYSGRQARILAALLEDERLRCEKDVIRVLDVPSSAGTASLDFFELLRRHYRRCTYVLGDLHFRVLYDRERECIFDEDGALLQVRLNRTFFSIYRPHCLGDAYKGCAALLLSPLDLVSRRLRKRFPYREDNGYSVITLLHPEVERRLAEGALCMRRMDVFEPIKDAFDLIISFNLLQENYFSRERIEAGMANLRDALEENGLLIMGDTEAYSVSRKVNGELLVVKREGQF
jgi:hypothetical protein